MRGLLCIAIILLTSASASGAELSLFGGYRTGGPSVEVPLFLCFGPCLQPSAEARDSESFGLILDLPFRDQLMFEILLSHQSGEFEDQLNNPSSFEPLFLLPPNEGNRFDVTYLHVGLLRHWRKTRISPFAAVGLGIAQLEVDRLLFLGPIDEDRLSASLAGGIKVELNKWLGVRLEGRGYWADMPTTVGDDLFQLELSSGLTFKL